MTPYDRISEQYAIFLKWNRHAPNRLIVNPEYYRELLLSNKPGTHYYGMKIVITHQVEEFELAFVYEVTDV